jgi:hypothetical protein
MEFLETAITLSLICKEEVAILILATRIFQPVQIQQVPKGVIWFWFLQFYQMCLGDVQDTIVISIVDLYVSFRCWMQSRLKNNNSVWNGKWARKLKFFWILVGCFLTACTMKPDSVSVALCRGKPLSLIERNMKSIKKP